MRLPLQPFLEPDALYLKVRLTARLSARLIANTITNRDQLFTAVKQIDPDGVYHWANNLQHHHGEYIIPGPNWLWSIDGHCKLNFYGIEIYAAIDAYSQYII